MLRTRAFELPAILPDDSGGEPMPRLALAGGSDRRPPDDSGPRGQVIPFPRERLRSPEPTLPNGEGDALRPPERRPEVSAFATESGGELLWPAWMAHVLTRYRAPEGGHGPTGVFI